MLPVLEPMGLNLDYLAGEGPVFANPVRSKADVEALRVVPAEEGTGYIRHTVSNILADLPSGHSLDRICRCALYAGLICIEGRGSRNYVHVKKMMYQAPELWHAHDGQAGRPCRRLCPLQIDSGVHALQIFDSWVGCLSVADYRRYVARHSQALIDRIKGRVPIIYFGTGNPHLVDDMYQAGPDVMALDWRTPLAATWDRLGCTAVQGNLDPIVLCADRNSVREQAEAVLAEAGGRPGHIFNLGHGIIPETPVDNVKYLVDLVHERSVR
jgi:uroporphyrinogen decarboxylase